MMIIRIISMLVPSNSFLVPYVLSCVVFVLVIVLLHILTIIQVYSIVFTVMDFMLYSKTVEVSLLL